MWEQREPDELVSLVDRVRVASWRWECQGDYSAIDATLLHRWRNGLGRDPADDRAWVEYVRGLRQRGVRFERVRMLTEPLTEYLRMQLDFTYMNVQAGEDVRWVEQAVSRELGMPSYDFYLIDDLVVVLDFDDAGMLAGARTSTDPVAVERHRRWRDVIWPHTVPHERYLADLAHRKVQ
jgi:hypothetical protein